MKLTILETDVATRDLDDLDLGGASARIKIALDTAAVPHGALDFQLTSSDGTIDETKSFALAEADVAAIDSILDGDTLKIVDDVLVFKLATPSDFEAGLLGLNSGIDAAPKEVRIELRSNNGDNAYGIDTPFFAIFVTWDVAAKFGTGSKTTAGEVGVGVDAQVHVSVGFSAIHPPFDQASGVLGLENHAIRFDFDSLGISSGWLPLSLIENVSVPDLPDLPDFQMVRVLKWIADLLDIAFEDLDIDPKLPEFLKWDLSFPAEFSLPLGVEFQEASIFIREVDDDVRVEASLSGLRLNWNDLHLDYEDFKVALVYENDTYVVTATIASWVYPKTPADPQEPVALALPFNLLTAKADCYRVRLGVHASGGSNPLCFEALLEIGGLELTSGLAGGEDNPIYKTDLRLLMRDLTVISNEISYDVKFFGGIEDPHPVIVGYQAHQIPALSFAEDLAKPPKPGAQNEYGLTFLDGAFRQGERIFLAWTQTGNQLIKALAHDLLGKPPAGALPDDAATTAVALEVAWFPSEEGDGEDTQVRLEWTTVGEGPDAVNGNNASPKPGPIPGPDGSICFSDLNKPGNDVLADGLFLPVGKPTFPNLGDVTTGSNPLELSLPGISMSLARPSTYSLVYRRDADARDKIAYLLHWDGPVVPQIGDNRALASIQFGFATTGSDGGRSVQETGDDSDAPLFGVNLGHYGWVDGTFAPKPEVLQVLGWVEDSGPSFLQVYEREAMRLPRLLPPDDKLVPAGAIPADPGCPEPSKRAPQPVLLRDDAFTGISVRADDDQPWRVSLQSSLTKHLLKMFGSASDRQVGIDIKEICLGPEAEVLSIKTEIKIRLSNKDDAPEVSGELSFALNLKSMALTIDDGARLSLDSKLDARPAWVDRMAPENPPNAAELAAQGQADPYFFTEPIELLGLDLRAMAPKTLDDDGKFVPRDNLPVLTASFDDGSFKLTVEDDVDLLLHYDGFGDDGLTFLVAEFEFGPGGLDISASLLATTLKLPGLKKPFSLEEATLVVRDDRVERIEINGSGNLPELLNEAPVTIFVALEANDAGRIELVDFDCVLGDGEAPIYSRGTRCRFELTQITIDYDDKGGTAPRAWHFLISGSMRFAPDGDEFTGALLEDFKSISMEFTNAPLSDEFFSHISLIAELNEPKRFKVFNLFEMEVRAIGFHPNYEGFPEPGPAIIIAGQCEFADIGDVLSVEIDFHRMYLGLPKKGEIVPQVDFKGLRVEISTGGFKIAGRVDREETGTVSGFKGEGTILIPGLPELSAAFAFTRLRASEADPWKRGWFVAVEASRISFQIGPLPLYLRQIGLGFGYRYTSAIIKRFEEEDELGPLIALMQKEISNHQTLARIDTWAEDPERGNESSRWSIGLEGVFSMSSANSTPMTYNAVEERKLKSVVAQLLIFIRSDLTFLAAAKVWLPISADDFFEDRDGMRRRPGALGFMIYSAPKSRLLIHGAKGKNPYLGPKDDPVPEEIKAILDNSHFEATFLSEPGLVHAELGWPDRLFFKFQIGPLKLECRGGILFRAENDMLVHGIYFSARGEVSLGGELSLGIVGVRITAHIRVSLAMRLMIGIALSRPSQSSIYAAVGIDISVRFEVYAWFRLKLRFCTISLSLRFAIELQIIVALELGWAGSASLGFRGRATVVIGAFGRSLRVRVAVGVSEGDVRKAQARMEPYMRSYLEPGQIPPVPGITNQSAIDPLEQLNASRQAEKVLLNERLDTLRTVHSADAVQANRRVRASSIAVEPSFESFSAPGATETATTKTVSNAFSWALMRGTVGEKGDRIWFGWIVPRLDSAFLYPAVPATDDEITVATLSGNWGNDVKVFAPRVKDRTLIWEESKDNKVDLKTRPKEGATLTANSGGGTVGVSLAQFLAGSYVPHSAKNFMTKLDGEDEIFPSNWTPDNRFALAAHSPDIFENRKDERLTAGERPEPRRALDPDNVYDAAILKMRKPDPLEEIGDAFDPKTSVPGADEPEQLEQRLSLQREQLRTQAEGNFSFMMRGFMDDLMAIAEDTRLINGEPTPWAIPKSERPVLPHLGLLVAVVAKECPDWLCSYVEKPEEDAANLAFAVTHRVPDPDMPDKEVEIAFDGPIEPIVDFRQSSFEHNPPRIDTIVTHLDDETLNIGWNIDWGRQGLPDTPKDADYTAGTPEDYLREYEIVVAPDGDEDALGTFYVCPGDGLAETLDVNGQRAQERIKLRFQFNKPLVDLGLQRITGRLSVGTQIAIQITPIAQDGTRGDTYPAKATYRPSARPLPPDDAWLKATPDARGRLSAKLSWRELEPPNAPDVTARERWDLILRPMHRLPLGAWPVEASETEDSGLLGATGLAPQDGDIVLALKSHRDTDGQLTFGPDDEADLLLSDDDAAPRDPALRRWHLAINDGGDDKVIAGIYDHRGLPIPDEDRARRPALARNFFRRTPSTSPDGAAWRVFLRSSGQPVPVDPTAALPQDDVSGLVRVNLFLDAAEGAEPDKAVRRALDHLEWTTPRQKEAAPIETQEEDAQAAPAIFDTYQLGSNDIHAVPGALHTAAFLPRPGVDARADGDATLTEAKGAQTLTFLRRPGNDRGVTLRWNANTTDVPVDTVATWELFETRMDDLVNFDRRPEKDNVFGPTWRHIRSVIPADTALAQRAVTSFVQPEIWDAIPPTEALTLKWMQDVSEGHKGTAVARPSGYSWAESALKWPEFPQIEVTVDSDTDDSNTDDSEKQTQLVDDWLTEGREAGDGAFAFPEMEIDTTQGTINYRRHLAARRDVGEYLARRRLHPWLSILLGTLARLGAPANLGGTPETGTTGVYEVEITPGKPVTSTGDVAPNPIIWMQQDLAGIDPMGWGGLSHLGLGATVALRDPLTRAYLTQDKARDYLGRAVVELARLLKDAIDASVGDAKKVFRTLANATAHLAIDLPLQTDRAIRTRPGEKTLDPVSSLSMIQISLRPIVQAMPEPGEVGMRAANYAVAQARPIEPTANPITFDVDVEAIFPARGHVKRVFREDQTVDIGKLLGSEEHIILRWGVVPENKATPLQQLIAAEVVAEPSEKLLRLARYPVFEAIGLSTDFVANPSDGESSPFGRFLPEGSEFKRLFVDQPNPEEPPTAARSHLDPLLNYVSRAFVILPEPKEGDPPPNSAVEAAEATRIKAEMLRDTSFVETVSTWAERYFVAAPIADPIMATSDPKAVFDPLRLTAAIPKRIDPARMAPDALGQMTYTHPVNEDWATMRSFAIRVIHRYSELHQSKALAALPEFGPGLGRADAELPRRRPVPAPSVLGQRVITADGDAARQYHEVTLSDHPELALSRANIALSRKLEFMDIRRRYSLRFRDSLWLTQLVTFQGDFNTVVFANDIKDDWTDAEPDSFEDSTQDALAAAPMARLGAIQMLSPAEPHYYDQRLDIVARARSVQSPHVHLRLPPPAAASYTPASDDGSPAEAEWHQPSWKDLKLEEIGRKKDGLTGLPDWVAPWLEPIGAKVTLRYPRLFESLPDPSADHAAAERHYDPMTNAASHGRLPDPAARIEIASSQDGIRSTVAVVERAPETQPVPFVLRKVSSAHQFGDLDIAANATWPLGVPMTLAVADSTENAMLSGLDAGLLQAVPTKLTDDSEFDPTALPRLGRLSHLAPLMLRLQSNLASATLRLAAPLAGPKWLVRPHLPALAQTDDLAAMTAADLMVGLRLLLDTERRRALFALAKPADGSADEWMRLLETTHTTVLSDPLPVPDADLTDLVDLLLTKEARLLRLRADTVEDLVDSGDIAEDDRLVLVQDTEAMDVFDEFAKLLAAPPSADLIARASDAAIALADLGWRSARSTQLRLVAHRGNAPGVDWGAPRPAKRRGAE